MLRARDVVICVKAVVLCAVSSPYFLPVAHSHIDNNSKISGFWRVAKTRHLLTFLRRIMIKF